MLDTSEHSSLMIRNGSNSSSRSGGGDRSGVQGQGTTGAPPLHAPVAAAAQGSRHHFAHSLSELSSPLSLRRHSPSPNRSPAPGLGRDPNKGRVRSQTQSHGNQNLRDSEIRDIQGQYSTRGSTLSKGLAAGENVNKNYTSDAPSMSSQDPHLNHVHSSRTVSPLASAVVPTGSSSGSSRHKDSFPSRTAASPASLPWSHAPHIHSDKDLKRPDKTGSQQLPAHRDSVQQHRDHEHSHRHRHHHHHHRQHHSWSTGGGAGYTGGHLSTIAALAATATAVAAASPTTPVASLPTPIAHTQANTTAGSLGPEATQLQKEQLQQHQQQQQHERQASVASGVGIAVDPVAIRAAAAALKRIQREQSRNAASVLRAATTELDQMSSSTSQRLDAVYGSILTRLGVLQDAVLALRSLALAARATNRRFTFEAEAIAHDFDQQVTQLEAPDLTSGEAGTHREISVVLTPANQQYRLEQLSSRVHRGRQTIQTLAERVAAVHNKVQRWERAEGVWQERTRARLRAFWVIVSSVSLVLVLMVLLAVMLRSPGGGISTETSIKPNHPIGAPDVAATPSPVDGFRLTFPEKTYSANNGEGTTTGEEVDPLRRLLDEL
ncbi:hypothetical protein SEPCBS119000_006198 [Sporothrix epigloea]|uniref:Uncharacterized protein n=1 Tax=Sporothrix epigloea TaxID=1892477 RepID=A0ABP0E1P4_9PEZI